MGLATRLVNSLAILLVGEPLSPITFPSAEWELREPHIERDESSQTLTFQVRDSRYPKLRGTLAIKLTAWTPVVRWRTRVGGGGYVPRRPVYVSDNCHLRTPGTVGRVVCRREELETVVAFLKQQRFDDGDNGDAISALVPSSPPKPRGGLGAEAIPED